MRGNVNFTVWLVTIYNDNLVLYIFILSEKNPDYHIEIMSKFGLICCKLRDIMKSNLIECFHKMIVDDCKT